MRTRYRVTGKFCVRIRNRRPRRRFRRTNINRSSEHVCAHNNNNNGNSYGETTHVSSRTRESLVIARSKARESHTPPRTLPAVRKHRALCRNVSRIQRGVSYTVSELSLGLRAVNRKLNTAGSRPETTDPDIGFPVLGESRSKSRANGLVDPSECFADRQPKLRKRKRTKTVQVLSKAGSARAFSTARPRVITCATDSDRYRK